MKELTIPEAAERLGVSPARIRDFINEGRLKSKVVGQRIQLITEREIERFSRLPRNPGRPKKMLDK